MKRTLLQLTAIVYLVATTSAGCKESRLYSISGKITRGGEPLVWKSDNSQLIVIFVPIERKDDSVTYRAETNRQAGTYSISGIPPGQYLVSIQQTDPIPTHDLLNFAYGPSNSPLRKEVTQNGQVIDIDLPDELPGGGSKRDRKGQGKNFRETKGRDELE